MPVKRRTRVLLPVSTLWSGAVLDTFPGASVEEVRQLARKTPSPPENTPLDADVISDEDDI